MHHARFFFACDVQPALLVRLPAHRAPCSSFVLAAALLAERPDVPRPGATALSRNRRRRDAGPRGRNLTPLAQYPFNPSIGFWHNDSAALQWLPFLVGALLSGAPSGQQAVRTYLDPWTTPHIAAPLQSISDLDGDPFRELLLGESNAEPSGEPFGEVRILRGSSGEVIRSLVLADLGLGRIVADLGDVTGDGTGAFTASGYLGPGGRGRVWSAASFELLRTGPVFDSACGIGDIDGDGIGDYVQAGYGFPGSPGSATVYLGGSFQATYTLSEPGSVNYGHALAAMGDIDRDGSGDFAVGAPGLIFDEACSVGEVYVYSGVDGERLYSLQGEGVNSLFGEFVVCPGDINGDGLGDLAVGAQLCCVPQCDQNGPGRLSFFDGLTGTLLEHVAGETYGTLRFGSDLLAVGDLDGNGYGDILTQCLVPFGGWDFPTGALIALNGNSREFIYQVWSAEAAERCGYGAQLSTAGDVDGDDFPDYYVGSGCRLLGAPDDRIDVISGAPIGVRTLGGRCGDLVRGRPLRIGATGVPEIGRSYLIHISGIDAGAEAMLLLGDLASPSAPGSLRAMQCSASIFPSEVRRVHAHEVRPGEGVATATVLIPNSTHVIGMKLHAQWLVGGPRRWSTSRVLELVIQPSSAFRGR